MQKGVCVCVCVCVRERERENTSIILILVKIYEFAVSFLVSKNLRTVLAPDKVVGDFNEIDAVGLAFKDIINSIGVRQHVSLSNHPLDLILSHRDRC